jgi:enterochelin esterase-like enzyme
MGGGHTLYIAIPNLDKFAYIGVFSSGLLGIAGGSPGRAGTPPPEGPNPVTAWEEQNKASLDNPALKKDLKLFWFSTGKDDGLIATSKATVEFLKMHGFNATLEESPGAHTWINWRNYLDEFACKLFN